MFSGARFIWMYTVRVVPEEDVVGQKASFDSLLRKWGRITPSEADRILDRREPAEPEADLAPEVVSRLKARIARGKCNAGSYEGGVTPSDVTLTDDGGTEAPEDAKAPENKLY